MKASSVSLIPVALLALACPLAAQTTRPPAREVAPSANNSGVVPDGIVFYQGQTYLIQNGRAAQISQALVPDGQVLTPEGALVPQPAEYIVASTNNLGAVKDGIIYSRGQSYWIRNGLATVINQALIPDGKVLAQDGKLLPLPSDFSGFNLDRTPGGVLLKPAGTGLGQQTLSNQAGVSQVPSGAQPNTPAALTTNATQPAPELIRPVGGVNPQSGVHTIPGNTAATITNGSTRAASATPPASTAAKPAVSR